MRAAAFQGVDQPTCVLDVDGRILLNELVSKQRPLEEVNAAFADMEAGTVARSALLPR